ncbi:BREX-1 system adenine-specific DNA-methyltransferase PglX [uncultured Lutibacter sp.]|uniref:BREX-1 system adenine-specific DNA-methyltransferase PglX n=1 Tax=uncultured Lutibacter sp. TaxID=437739 RepID=UPI00260A4B66|nr:BREX-1 system adenine-specific DNA-methyltransferase PglX [uncultured Lutibacter sp.]
MALTQSARNKIKSFVQSAKKLLMNEFESQLQQYYGIKPNGDCVLVEELTSRDAAVIETARLLRQRLHYLEEGIAGKNKAEQAVRQLVREQAFTILNRFAAIRMAEERNIIRESIRKAYNSEGFLVFDELTGGSKTAEKFTRYTWYIQKVFDELAIDLPAVFNRFSPYGLLFPSEKVLLELLAIIDDEELNIFREIGHQPINLWMEDETIGWVYQYYNSREEISEMREASGAPRNSRELAVRNQFFTPRYVVQFLVDNSLGRQWYEMTKGNTSLTHHCQYMVKRAQEIFLNKGEELPEAKIVDAHYIENRILKDPREILMLDPACGSMHFGLYCFDVFEQIYIEAWDNHPNLLLDLRDKFLREEYIKHIPGYILQYNIHGVDIDPRALQIAGLSLWLRAQKSYDNLNVQPADRPAIRKSNLVLAEPMPGDAKLLSDFTQSLPGPIGKLVRVIWEKMQLVGETGMLLKIEEELKKEIEIAKQEWTTYKNTSAQSTLFDSPAESKVAEMAAIYGKGQKITKDFFDTAEEQVLEALKNFAENEEGEDAFQKLLFAEDTARGFAFIELCRKKYDVIVMNPPFGAGAISTEVYYKENYPDWGKNILCCFFNRMNQLSHSYGNIGAIFDRSVTVKSSYDTFRINNFIGKIKFIIDTGWGVLDANVETTAYVLSPSSISESLFFDLRESTLKENELIERINNEKCIILDSSKFVSLPNSVIGYYFDKSIIDLFNSIKNIRQLSLQARDGHNLGSFEHFRVFWEVSTDSTKYYMMYNGGSYSLFYYPYRDMCLYGENGNLIRHHRKTNFRNPDYQLKSGISYGKRGDYFDAHILKENTVFTKEGQAVSKISENDSITLLSFFNSSLSQYLLSLYSGQHKASGYVNLLPLPSSKGFSNTNSIINIKRSSFEIDETCLETKLILSYFRNDFNNKKLLNYTDFVLNQNLKYINLVDQNDKYWIDSFSLSENAKSEIEYFKNKRPIENLYSIQNVTFEDKSYQNQIAKEIIMNVVGLAFERWDINFFNGNKDVDDLDLVFKPLLRTPRVYKKNNAIEYKCNLYYELLNTFKLIWNEDSILNIESLIPEENLIAFIDKPSGFFDYHYQRYTQSRREAPIYWPLATKSNQFVIWVYYPTLNDNTLFSIVNDLVDPKIIEIDKEVKTLEMGSASKDLNDQKEFLNELKDFKEELLRVAQLPYKPNQDDGVLITAAPLHNLFNHTKWRKSTEACWKALQKGEYDWAHLAYSIWPDRVTKKCKKDLSMAIAHGLEAICEVKPKVKVERKPKETTPIKQKKLL